MVYAFTQDVPIDEAGYRRVIEQLGSTPIDGQILHLCVRREDGGLRYIDVWESEAKCEKAFDDRIHAAVDSAFGGARPGREPEVHVLDIIDVQGLLASAVK
ncbi:MAG: hypothetical protein ABI632_00230 [Pseudolysinimonas sp.]